MNTRVVYQAADEEPWIVQIAAGSFAWLDWRRFDNERDACVMALQMRAETFTPVRVDT